MISGRYIRYRSMIYCLFCDICDSIRDALGRKKKSPEGSGAGYRRWVTLNQGGGVNAGLPSAAQRKDKDKEKAGEEKR